MQNAIAKIRRVLWGGLALFLIPFLSLTVQSDDGNDFSVRAEAAADGLITKLMYEHRLPGVTLSIVKDGKVVVSKGYGYANLEEKIPVDPDRSLFRMGSISKTVTWTAIMQLAEQGKLDLNTDINTYLKTVEIPDYEGLPLTLNDMMAHRSGFEDVSLGAYMGENYPALVLSLEQFVKTGVPARVYAPGTVTAYSNYAVALAGLIIQDITGQNFQDYIDENIFQPLGMHHTTFREPLAEGNSEQGMAEHLKADIVAGYTTVEGRRVEGDYAYFHAVAPAGSGSTTASDMARYMMAHMQLGELDGKRILKPETALQMRKRNFEDRSDMVGLSHGFFSGEASGYQFYRHLGGVWPSYLSIMTMVPEVQFGVFLSINNWIVDYHIIQDIPENLLNALFPALKEPADIKPPVGFAETGQRFAGSYMKNRRSFTTMEKLAELSADPVSIKVSADGYLVRNDGTAWVEVKPLVFRNTERNDVIVFDEDENGAILRYTVEGSGDSFEQLSFVETTSFLYLSFVVSVLLAGSYVVRLYSNKKRNIDFVFGLPSKIALGAAFVVIAFAFNVLALFVGVDLSLIKIIAKWLSIIASLLLLAVAAFTVSVWQTEGGFKIHYTAFAISGLSLIYVFWQWNFFGPYN